MREGGDPDGVPMLVHAGTPGSSLLYAPHLQSAKDAGVRLFSYDRPGYGGSTQDEGKERCRLRRRRGRRVRRPRDRALLRLGRVRGRASRARDGRAPSRPRGGRSGDRLRGAVRRGRARLHGRDGRDERRVVRGRHCWRRRSSRAARARPRRPSGRDSRHGRRGAAHPPRPRRQGRAGRRARGLHAGRALEPGSFRARTGGSTTTS